MHRKHDLNTKLNKGHGPLVQEAYLIKVKEES